MSDFYKRQRYSKKFNSKCYTSPIFPQVCSSRRSLGNKAHIPQLSHGPIISSTYPESSLLTLTHSLTKNTLGNHDIFIILCFLLYGIKSKFSKLCNCPGFSSQRLCPPLQFVIQCHVHLVLKHLKKEVYQIGAKRQK